MGRRKNISLSSIGVLAPAFGLVSLGAPRLLVGEGAVAPVGMRIRKALGRAVRQARQQGDKGERKSTRHIHSAKPLHERLSQRLWEPNRL